MPTFRPLDGEELRRAYETVFREAFPPQELKPLCAMEEMVRQGVYRPLGYFEDDTALGYAMLWEDAPYILIDYLCVPAPMRNRGIGSRLLSRLPDVFPDDTVFIGEAEAPTGDADADGIILRRLDFYRRTGAITLGYDSALFGVHYKTLAWAKFPPDEGEVMRHHDGLYRGHLSPEIYAAAVRIPLHEGEKLAPFDQWSE
jgi:GNAT superfamily N-acetyltransferase